MLCLRKLLILALPLVLIGCESVYTPQSLSIKDKVVTGTQQDFEIQIISLDQPAVLAANQTPYARPVVTGTNLSGPAVTRSEKVAISERLPRYLRPPQYTVGPGDVLNILWNTSRTTSSQLLKTDPPAVIVGPDGSISFDGIGPIFVEGSTLAQIRSTVLAALRQNLKSDFVLLNEKVPPSEAASDYRIGARDILVLGRKQPKISEAGDITEELVTRSLVVSSRGFINLLEAGKVKVANLTLLEAQEAVELEFIREGINIDFELIIGGFNSQVILLGGAAQAGSEDKPNAFIPITDRPLTLKEVLILGGMKPNRGNDNVIRLRRGAEEYRLSANKLLLDQMQGSFFAKSGDEIIIEPVFNSLQLDVSIVEYTSQKVLVEQVALIPASNQLVGASDAGVISNSRGNIITLGPRPVTIQEVLIEAGVNVTRNSNYLIRLLRDGKEYRASARRLLLESPNKVFYAQGGDTIIAEPLIYARQSIMITGAGTSPTLFALNAERRPSLADAIYGSKALAKVTANLRQVYVLREKSGMKAQKKPAKTYVAQLGAFKTQRAAKLELAKITRISKRLLVGKQTLIGRSKNAGATLYRLQVSGFANITSARQFCSDLRRDCFPVAAAKRPELSFGLPQYKAYQLDLSDPSRLFLARNFEMRPDDIVYVSTQPLAEFNTIVGQLTSTLSSAVGFKKGIGEFKSGF